jgi:CheY-like chemotaxis protein
MGTTLFSTDRARLSVVEAHEYSSVARILIVDDEQANVGVLSQILSRVVYTNLQTTTDPRLVLRLYQEFQPDLILLDLHMPDLDGFAVLEQLTPLIPQGTYLPVLTLTGDARPETRQRALAMGAKDFLTKPFDLTEVPRSPAQHRASDASWRSSWRRRAPTWPSPTSTRPDSPRPSIWRRRRVAG